MYSIKWALKIIKTEEKKHAQQRIQSWPIVIQLKNTLADKYIVLTYHVSYGLFQEKRSNNLKYFTIIIYYQILLNQITF